MLCHEILFKNYLKLRLKLIYGSFFLKGVQYFIIGMFQNSFCLDKNLHCFQCSGITNDTVDSLACTSLHRKNRYPQWKFLVKWYVHLNMLGDTARLLFKKAEPIGVITNMYIRVFFKNLFCKMTLLFAFLSSISAFQLVCICSAFDILFFILFTLISMSWYLVLILIYILLMPNDIDYLCMCLFAFLIFFLVTCL